MVRKGGKNASKKSTRGGSKAKRPSQKSMAVPQRTRMLTAPIAKRKVGAYSSPRGMESIRVKRTELAGALVSPGSGLFSCYKVPINPGLPSLAWLGAVASNYQQYRLKGLNFEFRSLEPTTTRGTVYVGVQYDVDQKTPVTEAEMSLIPEVRSGPVWAPSISCNVRPERFHATNKTFYVRSSYAADLDRYDGANLLVAVVDHNSTDTVGKFWVTYDFEFLVPSANISTGSLKAGDRQRACMMVTATPNIVPGASADLIFDTTESKNIPGLSYDATTGIITVDQPMRVESDIRARITNNSHSAGLADGFVSATLQPYEDAVAVVPLKAKTTVSIPAAENTGIDKMAVVPHSNGYWDLLPGIAHTVKVFNDAVSTLDTYGPAIGSETTWWMDFVGLLDAAGTLLAAKRHVERAAKQGVMPSSKMLEMSKTTPLEFKRMLETESRVGRPEPEVPDIEEVPSSCTACKQGAYVAISKPPEK